MIRAANDAVNCTPSFQDEKRRTPTQIFAKTEVSSNPKHWKPFGCPVYVLDNSLQGQQPFHKWKGRSKAGVYIGRSPQHGKNVSLVLDQDTGLVSPQSHVAFDPTFETVKDIKKIDVADQGWICHPGETQTTTKPKEKVHTLATTGSKKRKRQEASREAAVTLESQNNGGNQAAANDGGDGLPSSPERTSGSATVIQQDKLVITTKSGRKAKPLPRLIEAMSAEIAEAISHGVQGDIFCYAAAMFPDDDRHDYDDPLLIYKAISNPDTLYYHEAM